MAARIRKGDTVVVLTGTDKGRKGEVLKSFPEENRVLVSVSQTSPMSIRHRASPRASVSR